MRLNKADFKCKLSHTSKLCRASAPELRRPRTQHARNTSKMTPATMAFAVAALLASAQAQPGINATLTAHCVWNDAQCSDPIIHGAAEACHQSQEFCEGQCSSDDANATWCEGAPLYEQENAIASCSWADRESLDLLYQCDGVADGDAPGGDNETVQACQREQYFALSAACASCLVISEWNETECLLEATPSCSAHDAHNIFEMSACQVNHPNATQDQLEACYAGVSMDMTPGCLACLNTTSWDARACILDFRDLCVHSCTPCCSQRVRWLIADVARSANARRATLRSYGKRANARGLCLPTCVRPICGFIVSDTLLLCAISMLTPAFLFVVQ